MTPLAFDIGFDVLLLLVAGLIALVSKFLQALSEMRTRTRREMERTEAETRVDFGEPPPSPAPARVPST
ncbi:MAG: hypothetical protein ACREID_04835, partial [Planctomycetota bacterium]